ncbi:cupin domain-containing protein [Streptomyces sp. NPDC046197]|uniref:cupin domain-containing protein n=1 Tax=Streptomyces sp. NPDC046197 TaxID=3154337 RepID=UPI0033D36949
MTTSSIEMGTIPSKLSASTLEWLLRPVPLADFWREYWERRPLVVHRDNPGYFAELLTLDQVDQALSLAGVGLENIRVVVDGEETPVSQLGAGRGPNGLTNSLEALYTRYREGSTVVVNSLQDRWEPLQRVAAALGSELGARVQMNIYLTPPHSQGFAPHHDTHDVFIAQVHGSKAWRLAEASYELPLANRPYDKSQAAPEPTQEFELQAGDLLYLQRGTVHSGAANQAASLHVTLGIHPVLWAQALQDALSQLAAEDVRFRRSLPVGFALDPEMREQTEAGFAELLDALGAQLSPREMTARAVERVTSISAPLLRGHLLDLENLPHTGPDTPLRPRQGLQWQLTLADEVARLHFHNKTVQFPASVAEEVRWAAEHEAQWFTANAIPGDLDEAGRITLVRTLLAEGFLTLH